MKLHTLPVFAILGSALLAGCKEDDAKDAMLAKANSKIAMLENKIKEIRELSRKYEESAEKVVAAEKQSQSANEKLKAANDELIAYYQRENERLRREIVAKAGEPKPSSVPGFPPGMEPAKKAAAQPIEIGGE